MSDNRFALLSISGALALAAGTLYVLGAVGWPAAAIALLGVAGIVRGSL
jgi:xanthosine utilization system XapX-like protein